MTAVLPDRDQQPCTTGAIRVLTWAEHGAGTDLKKPGRVGITPFVREAKPESAAAARTCTDLGRRSRAELPGLMRPCLPGWSRGCRRASMDICGGGWAVSPAATVAAARAENRSSPRTMITHRRSGYSADGRERLNSGDDVKRVPRGVGVDPQRLLRVIRTVLEQPGAERERPLMRDVEVSDGGHRGVQVQLLRDRAVRPGGPRQLPDLLNASTAPPAGLVSISQSCPIGSGWPGPGGSSPGWYRRPNSCR